VCGLQFSSENVALFNLENSKFYSIKKVGKVIEIVKGMLSAEV